MIFGQRVSLNARVQLQKGEKSDLAAVKAA
jgi:hypothetical protein